MTIDIARHTALTAKLLVATHVVRDLISQIRKIEADQQTSLNEKLSQIKKIREEIEKVGTEIDNIKRELKLLHTYNVN
jgi:septal ring factor EnvC (AmiA/AmiB activator)